VRQARDEYLRQTRQGHLSLRRRHVVFDAKGRQHPAAGVEHRVGRTRVAVARNINVSGRLVFQEPVRIEGNFRGEVSSSELVVISDHGTIEGRVRTPRLLVLGVLRGDITDSRLVVLGPRARVFGRIEADSLRVCEGALLEGDVRVPRGGRPASG
jgi:cytoskeletal protein CcmA (bactofilin family)